MPEHLSKSDLDMLNTLRVYDSPGAMYDVLQSYGYKYAVLAGGIMDANSLSGSAAVNFLKLTAQRDGRHFQIIQSAGFMIAWLRVTWISFTPSTTVKA